jgi:nitrogen fixation protein FixH
MKLTNWGDIHKWSGEVLSDDYNDGQQMVMKVKTKVENSGVGCSSQSSLQV